MLLCLITHMIFQEGEKRWCFFFKLKEISIVHNSLLKKNKTYNSEKTEFIEMLEDVAVNPEDGCKMLKVCDITCNLLYL